MLKCIHVCQMNLCGEQGLDVIEDGSNFTNVLGRNVLNSNCYKHKRSKFVLIFENISVDLVSLLCTVQNNNQGIMSYRVRPSLMCLNFIFHVISSVRLYDPYFLPFVDPWFILCYH